MLFGVNSGSHIREWRCGMESAMAHIPRDGGVESAMAHIPRDCGVESAMAHIPRDCGVESRNSENHKKVTKYEIKFRVFFKYVKIP